MKKIHKIEGGNQNQRYIHIHTQTYVYIWAMIFYVNKTKIKLYKNNSEISVLKKNA